MDPKKQTRRKPSVITILWQQYQTNKCDALRNKIAIYYAPTVQRTALRIGANLPAHVTLEELISAGNCGLLQAIPKYRPELGHQPSTYLSPRIRGAILDYLREIDPLPRTHRGRINRVAELRGTMGVEPTADEIADELGIPAKQARSYRGFRVESLSRQVGRTDASPAELGDIIAAPADATTDNAEQVADALKICSGRERQVMELYYLEGLSMREVGLALDISEARVSQIHAATLTRLRQRNRPANKAA